MYTTCTNDCPTMTQQIRGALDDLGHDVPVLAVSVDPANDTPARARAFLAKQQMTGRMRFLLGSDAQLQRVWRTFGIQPQGTGGREHSASVVLLDDARRRARVVPGRPAHARGRAHDLRALRARGRSVLSVGGRRVGARRALGALARVAAPAPPQRRRRSARRAPCTGPRGTSGRRGRAAASLRRRRQQPEAQTGEGDHHEQHPVLRARRGAASRPRARARGRARG